MYTYNLSFQTDNASIEYIFSQLNGIKQETDITVLKSQQRGYEILVKQHKDLAIMPFLCAMRIEKLEQEKAGKKTEKKMYVIMI